MRLNRLLYGLNDAAWTWNMLFLNLFKKLRLQEFRSAPGVFRKVDVNVVCTVNDLFIFGRMTVGISIVGSSL